MLCDDCKNKEACRFYIASFENVNHPLNDPYYRDAFYCDEHCTVETPITNGDRIRAMSDAELADFIRSMVDENETHEVACYGCVNYGTHHSDPQNKGTTLYECEGCSCEGVGLDILKWLKQPAKEET